MNWTKEFAGRITVSDVDGTIIEMNDAALNAFTPPGGGTLIGSNVLDCHPEPSRSKLAGMMRTQEKNVYTIEKNGVRKLIYQSPWYENGEFRGFVELSLEIPWDMPHHVRK